MTHPVSGYRAPVFTPYVDPDASTPARAFCLRADTVAEGFLCDEPTVVSDACRTPRNAVDAFVCDDGKLAALEGSVWNAMKEILKTVFEALL